jgi:hypothetical protein
MLWTRSTGVAHGSIGFIKSESLMNGSTAWIEPGEMIQRLLILSVNHQVDSRGGFFFNSMGHPWNRDRGNSMADDKRCLNSRYRALDATLFVPTWSRRWDDSILLTYGGGNRRGVADDVEVARVIFNDGGGGFQWRSDSGNSSGSGGDG